MVALFNENPAFSENSALNFFEGLLFRVDSEVERGLWEYDNGIGGLYGRVFRVKTVNIT